MSDITSNQKPKDYLVKEKCADVLITLQDIASTNYRSTCNLPFYMDKAKEIEKFDFVSQALSELEDIYKHPRKYENIIHLLNAVCESHEAMKEIIVEQNRKEC